MARFRISVLVQRIVLMRLTGTHPTVVGFSVASRAPKLFFSPTYLDPHRVRPPAGACVVNTFGKRGRCQWLLGTTCTASQTSHSANPPKSSKLWHNPVRDGWVEVGDNGSPRQGFAPEVFIPVVPSRSIPVTLRPPSCPLAYTMSVLAAIVFSY
jgi:hypothetical protein